MRNPFVRYAERVLDQCRPGTTFEADFDDASEMVAVALALRSQGCQVRLSPEARRLFITVPVAQRIRMSLSRPAGVQ